MIILVSFVKAYGLPFLAKNLTLANFHRIFVGNIMAKASASALALSGVRTENGESATSADYIAGLILEALKRATGGTR